MRIEVANVALNLLTDEGRLEITVETKDGRVIKFDCAQMEPNKGDYPAGVEYVARAVKSQYSVEHGERRFLVTVPIPDEDNNSCLLEVLEG